MAGGNKRVPFIPCQGVEGYLHFGTLDAALPCYYKAPRDEQKLHLYDVAKHPGCIVFDGFELANAGGPFQGLQKVQNNVAWRKAHATRACDGGRSVEYYKSDLFTALAAPCSCMSDGVLLERTMTYEDVKVLLFNLARLSITPEFSLLDGIDVDKQLIRRWASAFTLTATFDVPLKGHMQLPPQEADCYPFEQKPAGRGYTPGIVKLRGVTLYTPEASYAFDDNTWAKVDSTLVESLSDLCDAVPPTTLGDKRKWPDQLKTYLKAFATVGYMRVATLRSMLQDLGPEAYKAKLILGSIKDWYKSADKLPSEWVNEHEPQTEPDLEVQTEEPKQQQQEILLAPVPLPSKAAVSLSFREDPERAEVDVRIALPRLTPEIAAKAGALVEQLRGLING